MLTPKKNEEQYKKALNRAYKLMQKDLKSDSKATDELKILSILIREYETGHYPIPKPNPIEAIKFRLEKKEENLVFLLRNAVQEGLNSGVVKSFDPKKHLRSLKNSRRLKG